MFNLVRPINPVKKGQYILKDNYQLVIQLMIVNRKYIVVCANFTSRNFTSSSASWSWGIMSWAKQVFLHLFKSHPTSKCTCLFPFQAHGGMGVCQDTVLAHAYASLRTLRLADGPDEVHMRAVCKMEMRKQNQQHQAKLWRWNKMFTVNVYSVV